jgi:hypothetical protein
MSYLLGLKNAAGVMLYVGINKESTFAFLIGEFFLSEVGETIG